MHQVVALALPEVVAFDLAIPAQVFGHRDEREDYSFTLCAAEPGLVPSTTGYSLEATRGLDALAAADTVVVPGYAPAEPPGRGVIEELRAAADRGARVVSVCTGAFALAAAGLLDGLNATTHWKDAGELAARYPAVDVDPDVLYLDTGQIMTSAGVAAGIDLCLHLVRADFGEHAAARVARRMVVAPHREGGQAQYLQRPVPSRGTSLAGTCAWTLQQLAEPVSVTAMARHAGCAPRTFARGFLAETGTTPLRWLTAQRLREARRLLEVTDLSVDQVAAHCGLGTAANLRLYLPATPLPPPPPTAAPTKAGPHPCSTPPIPDTRRHPPSNRPSRSPIAPGTVLVVVSVEVGVEDRVLLGAPRPRKGDKPVIGLRWPGEDRTR